MLQPRSPLLSSDVKEAALVVTVNGTPIGRALWGTSGVDTAGPDQHVDGKFAKCKSRELRACQGRTLSDDTLSPAAWRASQCGVRRALATLFAEGDPRMP